MAEGRLLSRHGRYDTFVGTCTEDSKSKEIHLQSLMVVNSTDYDQYTHLRSPDQVVLAHYLSRQDKDRIQNMSINQPRPPSSSGRPTTSGRPTSSAARTLSARRQHSRQDMSLITTEDLPDKPAVRPPSSLSKYRPLPAIGTPVPDKQNDTSTRHPDDVINSSPLYQHVQQQPQQNTRHIVASQPPLPSRKSINRIPESTRISADNSRTSAVSDNSVLLNRTIIHPKPTEVSAGVGFIERLDLSQLDKPDGACKRKTAHTNPSLSKCKPTPHQNITTTTGDLYDGDDDDSDSTQSPVSKHDSGIVMYKSAKPTSKKPVVIPSPDNPPAREVLLAVKLPTDGTRHQKYFNSNEALQSIVEFAEEIAGRSFNGYILVVASAPKNVFVDLEDTIENAGLEDKTVFHLEEYDWTD